MSVCETLVRASLVFLCAGSVASGADAFWELKDLPVAKKEDREDQKSVPPLKGASVLFDGKSLDGWTTKDGKAPAKWKLVDGGAVEVHGGDIVSKQLIAGSVRLHVEFRVPYMPKEKGQGRGNSGVYLQGRYEVQVLDSFGITKLETGDCCGIYGVKPASTNAAKAPTVWQSYDIEFHAPKFEGGKKTEPARMTVHWNGVKVHDDTKIPLDNTTAGMGGDPATPGPLMLQDHGNPVEFRNIWILPTKK